jgi:hypothetical protein
MSTIRENTTYTAHCSGCGYEYGDFDKKAEALDFIEDFPLCSNCEPSVA